MDLDGRLAGCYGTDRVYHTVPHPGDQLGFRLKLNLGWEIGGRLGAHMHLMFAAKEE